MTKKKKNGVSQHPRPQQPLRAFPSPALWSECGPGRRTAAVACTAQECLLHHREPAPSPGLFKQTCGLIVQHRNACFIVGNQIYMLGYSNKHYHYIIHCCSSCMSLPMGNFSLWEVSDALSCTEENQLAVTESGHQTC